MRGLRTSVRIAVRCLVALGLLMCACAASAQANLRDQMTLSQQPGPGGTRWTWLTLDDPRSLQALPADWTLQFDQVRFRRIAVVVTLRDGSRRRIERTPWQLARDWAPGGMLAFTIAPPGREVARLQIGLDPIDPVRLLRKVSALTPAQAARHDARWLTLMGLFSGLLLSALAYNLFVHAGERQAFQRWYVGWIAAALGYGLFWTNMTGFIVPGLVGPIAVRFYLALVGLVVALGASFLASVLEKDAAPGWLVRALRIAGVACFACGLIAASDWLVDPSASDWLLNVSMLVCVALSLATIAIAARRGSRVVWLYLLGWTPVIAVFVCRVARNFGLLEKSDAIDMATFAALGFESLVFSLLIAERFISLRRQSDADEADVRSREVQRETLRRASQSDFLTGLGNRAFFHEKMRQLSQQQVPFNLVLLDVDYLKELNDRQGHNAGDALLQHIGGLLAGLETPRVHCTRIGGDEFAVLCEGTLDECQGLLEALDALQGGIWARYTWSGVLSVSMGGAVASEAPSLSDLFQRAEIALYEAKQHGRGRRAMFDDRLKQQIQARLDLVREAQVGLEQDEFVLHFQPVIDVRTSQIVSVEALLRWKHPRLGRIAPGEFQPVMADREIGSALQQRVIDLAIDELRRRPGYDGAVSVNFTAMDLDGVEAARALLRKLAAAGVPPGAFCVEVTEGIILGRRGNEPAAALRELHAAGVRIALDDFGTGYASLLHLKEMPVDTLKIDGSFIAGLLVEGDESEEIVRAVLAMGHGLAKTVIAEGVETLAQLLRLRELGCDFAQGYLFGHPSPSFPNAVNVRDVA